MLPVQTVRLQERQEGTPASMLESLQEGWKGPLPHPMPTYNPVTGEEEKKENISRVTRLFIQE